MRNYRDNRATLTTAQATVQFRNSWKHRNYYFYGKWHNTIVEEALYHLGLNSDSPSKNINRDFL